MPYRWYQSDEPEGQRLLAAAKTDGLALPVVITPDGDPMVEPTDAELAARVGLATTPSKDFYDLIVIGGGPAGLGIGWSRSTTGRCPRSRRTRPSSTRRGPAGRVPPDWRLHVH